ncbi:MAG: YciI family protein [Phenylobacterium sp.]|uniref:YciI family protein n=1 Tax=Phenylobacterium sp. TaxID=1871053 RepID=UPI001A499FFA|nr:YciI family protein [Phenylobacterium sp.]MBL8555040.1 YciI family protein [Phenylobacterium sp.]
MPTFVLYCVDKPNALDLRLANREAHLAYVRSKADVVKLGGPMTDDAGDMAGSLLILDVADRAAAEAFTAADPYSLAGLFERVEIRPIRITLGKP